MTRKIALMLATSIALGSGAAAAASLESSGNVKLNELPYDLRQYVESRMGPEQTVDELVETTILNEISDDGFTEVRDVEVTYRARALDADGKWRLVDVDPSTYEVSDTATSVEQHANYDPMAAQPSQTGTGMPRATDDGQARSSDAYNPKAAQPSQSGTGR